MNAWYCNLEEGKNEHVCGKIKFDHADVWRCTLLTNEIEKIEVPTYSPWHKSSANSSAPNPECTGIKRPGKLYQEDKLIDSGEKKVPYIAVSYTWARYDKTLPEGREELDWCGRRVTKQALDIAKRLSKNTKLAIWIDAVCINQKDDKDKEIEMAKMDNIYRGAAMVVCIVPEVSTVTCDTVAKGNALMKFYANLDDDMFGIFLFATLGQNSSLTNLFRSFWWTRVWTFQEAVLNPCTFLVGNNEETIPIQDVLSIADPIQRRAAGSITREIMSQKSSFWDSVAKMKHGRMLVGDAMSCVWRRNLKEQQDYVYGMLGVVQLTVEPDYKLKLVPDVLRQLYEAANSQGDYSWTVWCHEIDHNKAGEEIDYDEAGEELCMLPTPKQVGKVPFMSITKWRSSNVQRPHVEKPGAHSGVLLPYSFRGKVTYVSPPQDLHEMVSLLRGLDFKSSQIWDMLFGMRLGLCLDIIRTVDKNGLDPEGIALALLASTIFHVAFKLYQEMEDYPNKKLYRELKVADDFACMAADIWPDKERRLIALRSQGGTLVIPEPMVKKQFEGSSIHLLPIEYGGEESKTLVTPRVAFVAHADTPFTVCAVGCLIPRSSSGPEKWEYRRFGKPNKPVSETADENPCDAQGVDQSQDNSVPTLPEEKLVEQPTAVTHGTHAGS